MTRRRGKVSWFGGPADSGVAPDEGLAFIYDIEDAPHLFLAEQPPGTTGLARRLDPNKPYIACRWNYDIISKDELLQARAFVRAVKTGKSAMACPADWGPHEDTDRLADISPGLMSALGIETDDEVIVDFPLQPGATAMPYESIVISSGHGKHVRGACGILDEVDEARRVVERVADLLDQREIDVDVFHDDDSQSQSENLNCIVEHHNSCMRELDVSIHFNAYVETDKPMGVEVLYLTQSELAGELSRAIADAGGFVDRGAKKRTDLAFLNGCDMPAILLEVCFVDSQTDADLYEAQFEAICEAIATVLGGQADGQIVPPAEVVPPSAPPKPTIRFDVEVTGDITIIINGVPVT